MTAADPAATIVIPNWLLQLTTQLCWISLAPNNAEADYSSAVLQEPLISSLYTRVYLQVLLQPSRLPFLSSLRCKPIVYTLNMVRFSTYAGIFAAALGVQAENTPPPVPQDAQIGLLNFEVVQDTLDTDLEALLSLCI